MAFILTDGERLLVVSIGIGLLALTTAITVCAVYPSCWLHVCLKRIAKKRKMKYSDVEGLEEGTYIKLTGTPQYTVECAFPSNAHCKNSLPKNGKNGRKREDSTYSSMSSSSAGNQSVSNYSEVSVDVPVVDVEPDVNYGQVTFSAWWQTINGNNNKGEIIVILKEAQDLPPRCYGGTCDPYLIMELIRDKGKKRWSRSSSSTLYELRTSSKKKTQHPIFKETFKMEITKGEIKEYSLKILAFDNEKYANDSELGEVTFPLRDISTLRNGEESIKTMDFLEPKREYGEILFGLSFLPTAERLTVTLTQAQNLPLPNDTELDAFAPFIRVLLIHNGKVLKKKKTSAKQGSISPVFNETLTFDVPPVELDNIVFLVVVSYRDPQDDSASSPDSPTAQSNGKGKSRHIGKVIVGSSIKGSGLHHWKSMKQSPRKQVTQWHILK